MNTRLSLSNLHLHFKPFHFLYSSQNTSSASASTSTSTSTLSTLATTAATSLAAEIMTRLDGGVYIANPNGLRGDIIPIETVAPHSPLPNGQFPTKKRYVVRIRGSNGTEIPIDDTELIEYTPKHSPEQPLTKEEEDVRFHLCQKAQAFPDEVYLQERMLAMELADEFTYMLVSNSIGEEADEELDYTPVSKAKTKTVPLPPDVEGSLLIRLLEAYFVGQGTVIANGRHLRTFHRSLRPFWKSYEDMKEGNCGKDDESSVATSSTTSSGGSFPMSRAATSTDIFDMLNGIFGESSSSPSFSTTPAPSAAESKTDDAGLLIFRAFCYAQHRLDYHKPQQPRQQGDDDDDENFLLDAYCVTFYVIKLLQGNIPGKTSMDFASMVNAALSTFGSGVDMTVDDVVWCFCVLFLRIGTDIRRYMGLKRYNRIFPKPFDLAMNEELFACQLAIELRPESPVSYLPAYRMVLETKTLVPPPFRMDWLKTALEFADNGLEAADRWGDPYFQYMFEMIVAYWIPTSINEPNPYTLGEIESIMNVANDLKKECITVVPRYMFWMGEKHELSLRQMLKSHPIDRDVELSVALVDAFTYTSLHLPPPIPVMSQEEESSSLSPPSSQQRKSITQPSTTSCAHCSKQVERRLQCSRCKQVHYCSKDCQVSHWKVGGHQAQCVSASAPAPVQEKTLPTKNNNNNANNIECGSCSSTLLKSLLCSKCGKVGYCNRACQINHWKAGHKHACQRC